MVLINLKSGGHNTADYVARAFEAEFGASNVLSLFSVDAATTIAEIKELLGRVNPAVVIVAGGDGTLSFVFDVLSRLRPAMSIADDRCIVAPFPMGTGNDLSCSLGFGGGYARWFFLGRIRFRRMLRCYTQSRVHQLDRWALTCSSALPHADSAPEPTLIMNNYLSVGFDAAVAHRLNTFRSRHPNLFVTRPIVKLWYFYFAILSLFTESHIQSRVSLTVDGVSVAVPASAKAIVVANVPTYAGGATIWDPRRKSKGGSSSFTAPSMSDGKLEVMCLSGPWHLGWIRMGLTYAQKLSQGQEIELIVTPDSSVQYDGEPMGDLTKRVGVGHVRLNIKYLDNTDVLKYTPPQYGLGSLLAVLCVALAVLAFALSYAQRLVR